MGDDLTFLFLSDANKRLFSCLLPDVAPDGGGHFATSAWSTRAVAMATATVAPGSASVIPTGAGFCAIKVSHDSDCFSFPFPAPKCHSLTVAHN